MSETRIRTGTTYLQVRATHSAMYSLDVVKSTRRRPTHVEPGCVVVRIELRIPDKAFQPLQPAAVVIVPEDLVQQPIEVEAT